MYGIFYTYVPTDFPDDPQILVLVHGTPENETGEAEAEFYATSWIDFAEEQGFILIAPAFNQRDFSSKLGDHALGGYRGLFGREIGADEWVLRLVRAQQQATGVGEAGFYLYGHSAGGQFTGRFVVTHPELVKKAVITSAATYPQPDRQLSWPFGLGALDAEIEWEPGSTRRVEIAPDEGKWLLATQVPLTVIVGMNDTAELPAELIPGQNGKNRLMIARRWVEAMGAFAEDGGLESRFELVMVPGIGHSMSSLLPYSQQAMLSARQPILR